VLGQPSTIIHFWRFAGQVNEISSYELPLQGFLAFVCTFCFSCCHPCMLWLFAPDKPGVDALHSSVACILRLTTAPTPVVVFAQVGSVMDALEVVEAGVVIIIAQGADAGGDGSARGAGLISLVPEICDANDSGLCLHATPCCWRCNGWPLSCFGAGIGCQWRCSYQWAILEGTDGGQSTLHTRLFEELRGTSCWPPLKELELTE